MEAGTLPSSATLLIVDDEPLMTDLFNQFMTKRGFRVLTASSGQEALDIVKQAANAVRIVITDMTMPDMDGLTLARRLQESAPSLPVILATGHEPDRSLTSGLPNIVEIVQKPYPNKALAERIRELLGETR